MSRRNGAAAWDAAIDQDVGRLIVILDGATDDVLDDILEAAQLIDREAQDEYERRLAVLAPVAGGKG